MLTVVLAVIVIILAAGQFASLLLAGHRMMAARRRTRTGPGVDEAVSVIRPVCGLEHGLEDTIRSGFRLSYPLFEMVFCLEEADDPAIPLLHRLMAEHPAVPARLLVGAEQLNVNPKLNNIAKGYRAARHDLLMMVDSNVLMAADSVERVLADWVEGTGAVSAPGIGTDPDGLPAEIELAFLNTFQARWLFASDALGAGYVQGKMMLFRRSDLECAGGLGALAGEVAEDSGLTKAMRRLGRSVRMTDCPFRHPVGRRTLREVWSRQARWAKLRRACFPALYASEIGASQAVLLALAAALVLAGGYSIAWVAALAAALYGGEAVLAALARWHLTALSPVHWLIRDVLVPLVWLSGWSGRRFAWRGHDMDVGDDDVSKAARVHDGAQRPARAAER
jgi:ceramide glucosyltransferase